MHQGQSGVNIQQEIERAVGRLSTEFMEVASELKQSGARETLTARFGQLFNTWLKHVQQISGGVESIIGQYEQCHARLAGISREKERLEVLFTSGIQFSSEKEMISLMGKAVDTVVNELNADAGFIILVDDRMEIVEVVARNMNPDERGDARDLSTSVLKDTLARMKPTQLDDIHSLSRKSELGSIVRLGIKSALCVPLISKDRAFGAVYLDRRDEENPFSESDLLFLLAFARQIVQGMEISAEISLLEDRLIGEAQMRIEDLRRQFPCPEIVGSSPRLFDILRMGMKIAPTPASLLVLGENGTGKELFARAVHRNSRRSEGPFVAIDCGAIPGELMESELFGYEPGAFTGAASSKPGKLEMANGGTLFLDEIGELSVKLQAKLLRVLQNREVERLGSVTGMKIDVRIIAATNRDIGSMVRSGEFRQDLYYRLKVIEVTMPPLRERSSDIAELAHSFLRKHSGEEGPKRLSEEALEVLENYRWPGNIRELENVVLRGVVLSGSDVIEADDLPPELHETEILRPRMAPGRTLADAETDFRRRYILSTLRTCDSKAEAARILGVNRTHFYRMLSQLGIRE